MIVWGKGRRYNQSIGMYGYFVYIETLGQATAPVVTTLKVIPLGLSLLRMGGTY